MALYLITGLPGTGKTTVCNELKARGITAYDGDKDHLAHWYDKEWRIVRYDGTAEFLRTHERSISREIVERLAQEASDKPVFLCNDPENEVDLIESFAKIFVLVADKETVQQRLSARDSGPGHYDWGKLPHEVSYSLDRKVETLGRIVLDATQSPVAIVDKIVASVSI